MTTADTHLGTCPTCGAELDPGAVLIEYSVGAETRRYVECDSCGVPVRPT